MRMGKGTGSSFVEGQLQIAVTSLSAGGSTSVTATLVDANGVPYQQSVDVSFTSDCVGTGNATITSPVTTTTGYATATYTAKGCQGTDTIYASATVEGATVTASGTVSTGSVSLGSIQFVSADPAIIGLKGSGLTETSLVTFKVLDQSGGPMKGQTVNFSLSTDVGGLSLLPASAVSGDDGTVTTVVHSGSVHTSVRVAATVDNTGVGTQSAELAVGTGLPDQDSFSLALGTLNPEAWDVDGATVTATAYLADRFNNPVPEGTTVTFVTEGGKIEGACNTDASGQCSVTWTSQAPRPADGRSTILAYAVGEESFVDKNGNGVFDDGDSFTDLGEPYLDANENGSYDLGEFFYDFNKNGVRDGPDGKYEGVLCQHSTLCGSSSTAPIGVSSVLVMAGSNIAVTISPASATFANGASTSFTVTLEDVNHGVPPAGTTIKAEVSKDKIAGPSTFTVPNTNGVGPFSFGVTVEGDGTASTGLLTITVTTPGGAVSYGSASFTEQP
ncbi:MAG: hypothetical protein D6809_03925 [Gammaproteobacteria bacterium]|nr:MAG: hypothetical protein D6809_03925 [Gammaproteobacteria bacterium]